MFIAAVLMAASCKVVEADFNNPTTDEYISRYCVTLFSDKVSENLEYFYNAYYVARFVAGDAELKVSPEYDYIRTRITGSDGKYEFDYLQYEFQGNGFFAEGGTCVVSSGRWLSITIKNIGIGQWTMEVNDGTKFVFTVVEENAEGLVLDMSVSGVKISPDLSIAKIYVSVFPSDKSEAVMSTLEENSRALRGELGSKVAKQLRIVPEIAFYLDSSLDYVEHIEELLKK